MTLDPAAVTNLLERTTALVIVDGQPRGTAFFIDDEMLLTCAHVITKATGPTCAVQVLGGEPRSASIHRSQDAGIDLALLTLDDPGPQLQPCVAIDGVQHDGAHLLVGFPEEKGVAPGLEQTQVSAHVRRAVDSSDQLVQIEAGKLVTFGLSGGPLVSLESGAVVAIVQSTRDPVGGEGGVAIPISVAMTAFDAVAALVSRPPSAVREWRDVLGRAAWQALGRPWDMRTSIDLFVSGSRTKWTIGMGDAAGVPHEITGSDLGDDLTDALFRWAAQRRRIHGTEEVALLGRLLAKGLVPPAVQRALGRAQGADVVDVRLRIEAGNDLADIPWELAAVPGQQAKYLATDEKFRFSRVVGGPNQPRPATAQISPAGVLAVITQPPAWRFAEVYGRRADRPYRWPAIADLERNLRSSIDGDPFTLTVMTNPQLSDVTSQLANGPFAVLHYAGVGKVVDDVACLAFIDGDSVGESWMDAAEVFDAAATSGVRLVVLELMLPPEGQEFDQVTASRLGTLISGSIEAVVVTQQPVHGAQCIAFNTSFYRQLKRPLETVEGAVQRARKDLASNRPVEDDASFGWFTVITGAVGGVTLSPAPDPLRPGPAPASSAPSVALPVEPANPPSRKSADGFSF